MASENRVRFAPSPTGKLHVGGARTALFNWAFAKILDANLIVRIEDTDLRRSSESTTHDILSDLLWLGIRWDEGPQIEGVGGDPYGIGPFFQSERLAIYDGVIARLIAGDHAYPSFESEKELDALRASARSNNQTFRFHRDTTYNRTESLKRMETDKHVIRFNMSRTSVAFTDGILGDIEFSEGNYDDFVLRKRDGTPTYHLAVVVDDEMMGITHILRGQEHLNNTPRHLALQNTLGYRIPLYFHLPLIFNQDGSKVSKRDKDKYARSIYTQHNADRIEKGEYDSEIIKGWLRDKRGQLPRKELDSLANRLGIELPEIDIEDFRKSGYLPDVICNTLALLGWSSGEKLDDGKDLERFDSTYLATNFSVARIGRSNARFNRSKLLSFNQHSIASLDCLEFFDVWKAWCEIFSPSILERYSNEYLESLARIMQPRCRTLADITSSKGPAGFLIVGENEYVFEPKAVGKFLERGSPNGLSILNSILPRINQLHVFDVETIEAAVASFAEELNIGLGKVAQPLRVAITGTAASPPLGETLMLVGKEGTLRRIARCIRECGGMSGASS